MTPLMWASEFDDNDAPSARKRRIYLDIVNNRPATRKRLAKRFHLRPTTVSQLVAELIDHGLVHDGAPVDPNRQGRPEISLYPVADRLAVIVIYAVSAELHGVLLSLDGQQIAESTAPLENTVADNDAILDALSTLAQNLHAQSPVQTEVAGLSLTLPGILDEQGKRWIFSTRWPRMSDLDLGELEQRTGLSVTVSKNLTSELRARLARRPEEREEDVLIVHWGYGIGASYARNGLIVRSSGGSFGEIGHWQLNPDCTESCYCEKTGCLETEAALWALWPRMRRNHTDVPVDEKKIGPFLRSVSLDDMPELRDATALVARAVSNLFLMLFPSRIVFTGPFIHNEEIMALMQELLAKTTPVYIQNPISIRAAKLNTNDEIIGAASPVFMSAIERLCATA